MQNQAYVLKDALAYAGGSILRGDVVISQGSAVFNSKSSEYVFPGGAVVIDCSSFFVCPGLVDLHVHLREPGFESKETIASGTAAAARGGFTTVCAMPNLNPVPDSPEGLRVELDAIARDARIRVVPYASITMGRKGEGDIVDMAALKADVAGFSDDGCGVQEASTMMEAMRRAAATGSTVVAHCEVNELLKGGYIHDGEYCRAHNHMGICSESEWAQVRRDCILAEETGARYHVCHVSTKESVEALREAKSRGASVSAETCPHYLLLTDADLQEDGRFKMNPPLRSEQDRDALIKGLEDGTIDCIVTDHAPHTAAQKAGGLAGSAMGIVGLETSFPLMYTHFVRTGRWTLEQLVERMSIRPREILSRMAGAAGAAAGDPWRCGDLAVFDLGAEYAIDPSEFLSKGHSTPFVGWRVWGRTKYTFVGGKMVYNE